MFEFQKIARIAVFLYLFLIFSTLAVVPVWISKLNYFITPSRMRILIYCAYITVAIFLTTRFYKSNTDLRLSAIGSLVIITFVSVYLLLNLKTPAEMIHLFEYGLMSFLVYAALRTDCSGRILYISTILISLSVGLIDETCQSAIPNRVCEIKDVMTNWLSSCLGLWCVLLLKRSQ